MCYLQGAWISQVLVLQQGIYQVMANCILLLLYPSCIVHVAGGIAGIVVVCAVVAMTIIASVLTAVFVKYNNGKKKQETKNTE